ncbi:MAG: OmpH family outer membrane protein [Flavobacterium sp.]
MKKHLILLLLIVAGSAEAQTRGVKIGYIDMEYILENVPEYTDAKNQLEEKALKWKQEIEVKKNEISKLKEALKAEQVLLTKELIEEREEEIRFQETTLLDYQHKRFGPNGDMIIQKSVLVKPIQDQVFTAVQDISEAKKYDFIFDKSSDLTILFAAKRHDISDQVVRTLTRASKRGQLTKKQLKEEEAKEAKEDMEDDNPALAERKKVLDDKKAERERLLEERKQAAADKKREFEEKRAKLLEDREAKKNGTYVEEGKVEKDNSVNPAEEQVENKQEAADPRAAAAAERARILEERKQALEERKAKVIRDREEAKRVREEQLKNK